MSYPAQEGRNPLATAHTTPPESTHFASSASIHPAASKIPEPTPAEYDRLKKDISEHGVRIAVVMTDDGRILDGRSRVKACTELGIKCPTRTATPDEMLDPMAASKSLNAHRRHLSADQIDQLLATYIMDNAHKVEADQQAAKAAQRAGLKRGTARGVDGHLTGKTSAKIAKDTGMSEDAVKRTLKIKKLAPERLPEVAAGNVSAMKVLEEIAPTEPATKVLKKKKPVAGEGSQSRIIHFMKYGTGRRSIESVIHSCQQETAIHANCWFRVLADAKQMSHPKFDQWIKEAIAWHANMGAALSRLQEKSCPTPEELDELLDPDLAQQEDEAAGATETKR